MQRRFVVSLLNQSSFSKHLTAVREANSLFKRAMDLRSLDGGASVTVRTPSLRFGPAVFRVLLAGGTLRML